jgi:hypothetical protein
MPPFFETECGSWSLQYEAFCEEETREAYSTAFDSVHDLWLVSPSSLYAQSQREICIAACQSAAYECGEAADDEYDSCMGVAQNDWGECLYWSYQQHQICSENCLCLPDPECLMWCGDALNESLDICDESFGENSDSCLESLLDAVASCYSDYVECVNSCPP